MDPKLLTEVERQEAVLADLPDEYEFPLFDGRQAIESQRKSAYKNTARAAREIIDNAYEAGAKNVWVALRRPSEQERGKHERRDAEDDERRARRLRSPRPAHRKSPMPIPACGWRDASPVRPGNRCIWRDSRDRQSLHETARA